SCVRRNRDRRLEAGFRRAADGTVAGEQLPPHDLGGAVPADVGRSPRDGDGRTSARSTGPAKPVGAVGVVAVPEPRVEEYAAVRVELGEERPCAPTDEVVAVR